MILTYYGPPGPVLPPVRVTAPTAGGRVPIADGKIYAIKSSDGRSHYDVHRLPDGRWTCPCKGFGYREDCRHVREAQLQEAQELLEAREHGAG